MRAILIGSVGSTKIMLEELIRARFPIDMVYSLDEAYSSNISGYEPIHKLALLNGIPYRKFRKINESQHVNEIKAINPDYIFVIGLSQLVNQDIIQSAKKGVIGYHPTSLPKFRGRAAIPWQIILGVKKSKVSMFFINEGIDSGDIIGQEAYEIQENDYARDVMEKSRKALRKLCRKLLPDLMAGNIQAIPQNEAEATYLLKRTPKDGRINWNDSVHDIHRLIRATSDPYPGAFSYYDGQTKAVFWRAQVIKNDKYIGKPGQIANISFDYIDIICADGLLRVTDYELSNDIKLVVGHEFS